MNNECERVGLTVPRITDNGFMIKVIFKRPSANGYKKDTFTLEKDIVNLEKDTVGSKKDTVNHEKDTVEQQLNTGRTPVLGEKDTCSVEKGHQLKTKRHQLENVTDKN